MELKVRGTQEFDAQYNELKESAKDGNGASIILLKKLKKAIDKLRWSYKTGEHISRDKIPEFYKIRYGVENLWKLNIDPNYRLIYTVRGTEVEVMSIILEYLDHKAYNRRLSYKSKR